VAGGMGLGDLVDRRLGIQAAVESALK
jgi:hypothetical protein